MMSIEYTNPYSLSKFAKIISINKWGDKFSVLICDEYEYYDSDIDKTEWIRREPNCLMTKNELDDLLKWLKES